MKGWITLVLLVTFASGGMTGMFVGRTTAPVPKPKTWIDNSVEHLRREGVTNPADLEAARAIYEAHEERVVGLQQQVKSILKENLRAFQAATEKEIREIRQKYGLR